MALDQNTSSQRWPLVSCSRAKSATSDRFPLPVNETETIIRSYIFNGTHPGTVAQGFIAIFTHTMREQVARQIY